MSIPPFADQDRPRCAIGAAARHDPMLGTAFPASQLLLVEQPGGWGIDGLADSQFDPAIAKRLTEELGKRGVRVLAVRRHGRQPATDTRRWAFVDCRSTSRTLHWSTYRSPTDLLPLLDGDLPAGAGTPLPRPTFLVCAHGTHDVCCAVEGRAVAAVLSRVQPERTWECSHLGGDRFAANVLVIPDGVVYGRVSAESAEDLIRYTDRGQVWVDHLRGWVGLTPVAQTAKAYVYRELSLLRPDDLQVIDEVIADVSGETSWVDVRVHTPGAVVRVRIEVTVAAPEILSCRARRPSRARVCRVISLTAH